MLRYVYIWRLAFGLIRFTRLGRNFTNVFYWNTLLTDVTCTRNYPELTLYDDSALVHVMALGRGVDIVDQDHCRHMASPGHIELMMLYKHMRSFYFVLSLNREIFTFT